MQRAADILRAALVATDTYFMFSGAKVRVLRAAARAAISTLEEGTPDEQDTPK